MTPELIIHYSGLVAMVIAWGTIVAPALFVGVRHHEQTISDSIHHYPHIVLFTTSFLIIGAIFQGLFVFYISERLVIPLNDLGLILYVSASVATLVAAVSFFIRSYKIHFYASLYYFSTAPLFMVLVGLAAFHVVPVISVLSFICAFLYIVGQFSIYLKHLSRGNALMEYFGFFILSVWTIGLTLA